MSYTEVISLPMSAIAYLICATQERYGVKLMYRHTSVQSLAILNHIQKAMDNA